MNEWLQPLLSAFESASVMLAAGSSFFFAVVAKGSGDELVRYVGRRGIGIVFVALIAFVLTQFVQAWCQGNELAELAGTKGRVLEAWSVYVATTVPGWVWALRQFAAIFLIAFIVIHYVWLQRSARDTALLVVLACTSLLVASAALSGHYAGGEDSAFDVPIHATHLLVTAYWAGSLPLWILVVRAFGRADKDREQVMVVVRRYSRHALILVLVAVVSGLALADVFINDQGDLFGTEWGWFLAGKLLLIAGALYSANYLRRALSSGEASGFFRISPGPAWYAFAELVLLLAAIALAASMSTVTPATHAQPQWLFPIRLSFDAISTDQNLVKVFWAGVLIACVAGLTAIVRARASHGFLTSAAWILTAGLGAGLLSWAVAVPAYENTYRRSEVPYLAESIASGIHHYSQHCVACHGAGARGDGPISGYALLPPADLSAPHTALHTAGDLFQWIGDGMPSGAMPGFSHVLDDEARWDLVNFLRAFSQGFQARIISERIAFNKPWLAAPDFYLTEREGSDSQLKALRGTAVLLVVARSCDVARKAVTGFKDGKNATGHSVVLACRNVPSADSYEEGIWYAQSPNAVLETYALLGRTIENKGEKGSLGTDHELAAYLIDKHGYVRARYVGLNAVPDSREALRVSLEELRQESVVPDPPDDHVH